jgi:dienelactone hydrolase
MSFKFIGWLCFLIFNGLQVSMAHQGGAPDPALPSRIEIHALETQTLSAQEFLLNSGAGKPHVLAVELKIPQGQTAKFPAVVLMHGSGGIGSNIETWTQALNQAGIASLVVDSFSGRGITSTIQDQTQLNSLSMMLDAFRALDLLTKHPRIDADKISILGFSKGAVASMFSASTRFNGMYGGRVKFAAHLGLYVPCNTRVMGDTDVTGAPMRFFNGSGDDYVSVVPCRAFVAELRAKGVNASMTEFDETEHGYDVPLLPTRMEMPKAQSTRNCSIVEKPAGNLVNASTGNAFSYNDPCIAIGTHVGYNPVSTAKTIKGVIEFLKSLH